MLLNIGVIGIGVIGQDYICCCSKVLQGSCIVVVIDINCESVIKVICDLGIEVNVYVDGYEVINVKEVEVVLVIFWGLSYEEFVLVVVVVGKYVFCEKLLVVIVEGCKCIVEVEVV